VKVALGGFALSVLVVVLAYQFNHFQPHGRLLSPVLLVIVLGLAGVGKWIEPKSRATAGIAAVVAMACLSVGVVTSSF
jgi:hypothetical protein